MDIGAISGWNEKLSITSGTFQCLLSFSSFHCSSNKSPERREKRRGRDSRSRSPVHIKEEIHDIGNGYGGFHPRLVLEYVSTQYSFSNTSILLYRAPTISYHENCIVEVL